MGPKVERGGAISAHGGVLREFQTWLKKEDPGFGDLRKVLNKRQEFLWVHRDFEGRLLQSSTLALCLGNTVGTYQLRHVLSQVKLVGHGRSSSLAHSRSQPRIGEEPQQSFAHRLRVAAVDEMSGHTVSDQFGYTADSCRHNRLRVGHGFRDHPAKHFFPSRKLADDIGGCKNSFTKRIFNHAGPGNPVVNSHRGGLFHVLLAICALAHQHKLHVAILLRDRTEPSRGNP